MVKKFELDRALQSQFFLTDPQLLMVQMLVCGYEMAEIARRLSSGEFSGVLPEDYSVTERTLYNWCKTPGVQAALQKCSESKVTRMISFETSRVEATLPKVQERFLEMVEPALDTIAQVLRGEGGREAATRLRAADMILNRSGVFQVQTLTGTERTTTTAGASSDTVEKLREVLVGRVLFGRQDLTLVPEKNYQNHSHSQTLDGDEG